MISGAVGGCYSSPYPLAGLACSAARPLEEWHLCCVALSRVETLVNTDNCAKERIQGMMYEEFLDHGRSLVQLRTPTVMINAPITRSFDPAADADQSLRQMLDSEETRRAWHSRFARSGFLFIMLFEIAGVLTLRFPAGVRASKIIPFEVFNLFAGGICLYITWTVWFHHHWRLLVFGFCALVVLSATFLSLYSGHTEPLFMSVIVLLAGGGSLIPWNARWQGSLTFLCVSWLGVNAFWSPISDTGLYQWLGLIAAGAIAYSGSRLGEHHRLELSTEIDALRAANAKLRNELGHYDTLPGTAPRAVTIPSNHMGHR